MKSCSHEQQPPGLNRIWRLLPPLLLMLAAFIASAAQAVQINVVDGSGNPLPADVGFRWLVEEDNTKQVDFTPAQPGRDLSMSFHTSYMRVIGKGTSANPAIPLDATKRYFVSVLPNSGYQMGGAPIMPGQQSVTVTVNTAPIPTAQISVFAFNDNSPINGAPDLPQEQGLAGFAVQLYEAGGTYGASGGLVSQDAYGNPLGTTYDKDGNVLVKGDTTLKTGADGTLLIKNLAPAKYTIQIVPPAGSDWHQTSTIEGTKGIDAWVAAREPSYFQEFGPPGHHVFIGFVQTINDRSVLRGSARITGKVVNLHMSRPPDTAFYNGHPVSNCWVGLNEMPAAGGRAIFTSKCNQDSTFSIPNVPPGQYQLVIWDDPLDLIIATHNVDVPANVSEVALQEVPVFNWFSRIESTVFYDANQNGVRDPGEQGIGDQVINLRFRDGSIYQTRPTDPTGRASFPEVFPFFNWLITEVDFARFKATGATVAVDAGGPINPNEKWSYGGKLNPQPQACTADDVDNNVPGCTAVGAPMINPALGTNLARAETGPVLLQAFQGFLGQTNVIEWGKVNYASGENGGITGVVTYATTRAEDDPRYAVAENWEPGIPRVQVNLYRDANGDKVIDDNNNSGRIELADVDNYPFGWRDGGPKGPEDIDHNGNGVFDMGDAVQIVWTDSWDDSLPSGCQGEVYVTAAGLPTDCYDGLRNFNQVRPGVFDGGYAFNNLPAGTYIVEAITPPGYEHVKEEDKNVDFGDAYKPSPLALPAECVNYDDTDGDGIPGRKVPPFLALFPSQAVGGAYAGQNRPQCDRKQVVLQDRQNAAANFFMFTEVPVAAHIVGFILDDTTAEFDPYAPNFGEKFAPSFMPVSIRDWTGREIQRVYTDQYGTYNALVPSSFNVNLPMPSGLSPNMLTACMNSPLMPDPSGALDPNGRPKMIDDPYFNKQYSQFCYTLQYLPGKTTYLDTPVIPVAAYTGPGQFPLDCEFPDGTPVISWVTGDNGPWLPATNVARNITIKSAGLVDVLNPAYDGTAARPRKIQRDFGFGATRGTGKVTLGSTTLAIVGWTNDTITATVPSGMANGSYQLMVTRGNGSTTKTGLTFHIGGTTPIRVAPGTTIQAAIDNAPNTGSPLILVPPGRYEELVIMHKPVRLQGWGAFSTQINAVKAPAEKLANWRAKLASLIATNQFSLLPGQTATFDAANNEPALFGTEEGPGILVVGNANSGGSPNEFGSNRMARIDGISVTGGDHGGGIFASGYASYLQITNNRVFSNQGTYGGGVRIGHADLLDGTVLTNSRNNNVRIQFNQIMQNGTLDGAGGGIALYTGSDNYEVRQNNICGNFSMGNGGGIGHLGRSNNGVIANNEIVFNQNFNQGIGVNGAGIFISGAAPIAPATLSDGAGNVDVLANLIQGNQAGAGDGGGIRTQYFNGIDVQQARTNPAGWYRLNIDNNMIVNNMAGLAGGGISLQDTARVYIRHNTVANNDSTGTAGAAFAAGSPNQSTPQPAGIVSRAHSSALAAAFGNSSAVNSLKVYSNPALQNNIVWQNRSFYWRIDNSTSPATYGLRPVIQSNGSGADYWDFAVLGTATANCLAPSNSIVTARTQHGCTYSTTNLASDPLFVRSYTNSGDPAILVTDVTTSLTTAAAFDEGGNYINVRFFPLTLFTITNPVTGAQGPAYGNYHLQNNSPAENLGATGVGISTDFDGEPRPQGTVNNRPDAGADERP